jgi:hypothetical protein
MVPEHNYLQLIIVLQANTKISLTTNRCYGQINMEYRVNTVGITTKSTKEKGKTNTKFTGATGISLANMGAQRRETEISKAVKEVCVYQGCMKAEKMVTGI